MWLWCTSLNYSTNIKQMLEQRRKLPPMINERSLFTRAAPYGDKDDPFYHSPSNRIGNNYSPSSMRAASILFEHFSADPSAPRPRGSPRQSPLALSEVRSMHASSQPLSPRPPLNSPSRSVGGGLDVSPGAKRGSPDSPLADLDGKQLGVSRGAKSARLGVNLPRASRPGLAMNDRVKEFILHVLAFPLFLHHFLLSASRTLDSITINITTTLTHLPALNLSHGRGG